ncbi:hypothetical protein V6N12_047879 [Hibiscus sabdariffa]|uniref:Uncharacterized protein n=1 Tax=Hibiscus sabdariffa TaxID=183260 RepID=A0ABR2CU95_9ROSI
MARLSLLEEAIGLELGAASLITLECALQTHPNITIIGEEKRGSSKVLIKPTLKDGYTYLVMKEYICGLPTNFDATYCYALGYDYVGSSARALIAKSILYTEISNLRTCYRIN